MGELSLYLFADPKSADGLREIDLGAGHSSASKSLAERVIGALRTNALLNESPGVGYIERRWPPALKESGAWPLKGLQQAFLDGSLERVIDPDADDAFGPQSKCNPLLGRPV